MRRSLTTLALAVVFAQVGYSGLAQGQPGALDRLVGQTFSPGDVKPANSGPGSSGSFGFPNPTAKKPSRFQSAFTNAKNSLSSTFSQNPRGQSSDPTRLNQQPAMIANDVYLRYADLMVQSGKAKDSLAYYNVVLSRNPGSLGAMIGIARAHDRLGKFDPAWRAYMVAVQTQPNNPVVHNDLGMCCARHRRVEPSVKAFSRAVELAPQKELYRNNLARALIAAGRTKEGLQQLLTLNPPAAAHYNFAFLLNQQGDREQALFHLRQSLRLDPKLAQARGLYEQLGGSPRSPVASNTATAPQRYQMTGDRRNLPPNQRGGLAPTGGAPRYTPPVERMPRVERPGAAHDSAFQPRTSSLPGRTYLPRAADQVAP